MGITPQEPQSLRTPSRVPLTVAKHTAAQLVRDSPQLDDDRFQEFHETDHIVEDLQSGTITERWLIAGNPTEAQASGALQSYQLGDPHLKHVDYFIVRREFRYHTHSDDKDERVSMMTVTWQRMPCPFDWSVDTATVLVPIQAWWSWENPTHLLTRAPSGASVSRPIDVVTFRMPFLSIDLLNRLAPTDHVLGRTNPDEFLGQPPGYWLLEDTRTRHLYGPHALFGATGGISQSHDSTSEVSFVLRGDPWRHHERWSARFDSAQKPIRPTLDAERAPTFDEMRAAHLVFVPYPPATIKFNDFLPADARNCLVDELSKP